MELSWSHKRALARIAAACRTAGAEGRFFPVVCADDSLRRTFETALKAAGNFELKLEKIPHPEAPGGPWPESLREHQGDHYNRLLWCLDFLPADSGWFEAAEARRQQAQKPGTWVLVWLPDPKMRRRLEDGAPAAWGERSSAPTLFTDSLAEPPAGFKADPALASTLAAEGGALARTGDPHGAIARLAEALRHRPDFAEARVALAQQLFRMNEQEASRAQYERALSDAEATSDVVATLNALAGLGLRERLTDAAESAESAEVRARALAIVAGEAEDPGPALAKAVEMAKEAKIPRLLSERLLAHARHLRRSGDVEGAQAAADSAQETKSRPLATLMEKGRIVVARAVLAAQQGREDDAAAGFDDARKVLADAFNLARTAGDDPARADAAMDLADLNFRAGSLEAALTSLDLAVRMAEEAGLLPVAFDVFEARRMANAAAGSNASALGDLKAMEELSLATGWPDLDARLLEARGDHHAQLGILGTATGWWDEAIEFWSDLGRDADAARCRSKRASLTSQN